jgi:hypothetical protein
MPAAAAVGTQQMETAAVGTQRGNGGNARVCDGGGGSGGNARVCDGGRSSAAEAAASTHYYIIYCHSVELKKKMTRTGDCDDGRAKGCNIAWHSRYV